MHNVYNSRNYCQQMADINKFVFKTVFSAVSIMFKLYLK